MSLFRAYKRFITKYPVLSQALQTGALMAGGDLIAQTAIEGKTVDTLNYLRTAQFASVGFCLTGPALASWYRILDRLFGASSKSVLKKVALDQLVFAPSFLGVFLVTLGGVQGEKYETIVRKLKRDYTDVVIANYKLWPWVQLVNFYAVPLQYQVLVVQLVAIMWNCYLSWKTQAEETQHNNA